MAEEFAAPGVIQRLLDDAPIWFVVGLGDDPGRDAYWVAQDLQRHGKRVVPIHPRALPVHGEQGYPSIAEAAAAVGSPDVVDMFVRSDRVGPLVDQAIAAGARAVWMQFGVVDAEAARRAADAGLDVVMDRCPSDEWARRGG